MARKTIDDIRTELRAEKEKTRKLRAQLKSAHRTIWAQVEVVALDVVADYPEDVFPVPEPGCAPERYSAAGCRLAANRIAKIAKAIRRGD